MWHKIYLFICLPQLSAFSHSFTPWLLILQALSSTYCLHVNKQEPGALLCKNNAYFFVYFIAHLPNIFRFPRLCMCLYNMRVCDSFFLLNKKEMKRWMMQMKLMNEHYYKPSILFIFFLNTWFHASWFNVNKGPTRCNSMQTFILCHVTLHVSGVMHPSSGVLKTVSATSGVRHVT